MYQYLPTHIAKHVYLYKYKMKIIKEGERHDLHGNDTYSYVFCTEWYIRTEHIPFISVAPLYYLLNIQRSILIAITVLTFPILYY